MTTDENAPTTGGSIHRLLDEAFAGVELTPDVQDLKEEIRFNLSARTDELEASGLSRDDAARRAIDELGDVRELMDELPASAPRSPWGGPPAGERVRPKPAFVVRIVIASAVTVGALLTALLAALEVIPLPIGPILGLLGFGATAAGWIVGDSLAQETTTNHPMPDKRAGGYYLATSLVIVGLGLAGLVLLGTIPIWCVIFAVLAFVVGIVIFAFLGATQTNRHKAWVLRNTEHYNDIGDRFTEDPASAARFGIYTAVIWVVAFTAFVVLSFTIGWAWSWLALVGGFVLMMTVLARMLFPPKE
jgi:hypothetical protein